MGLFIVVAFKAVVIAFLLKNTHMLTGGLSLWQQVAAYTLASFLDNFVITYLGLIAMEDATTSVMAIALHIIMTIAVATGYFYAVRKTCGAIGTLITLIGGSILVIFF